MSQQTTTQQSFRTTLFLLLLLLLFPLAALAQQEESGAPLANEAQQATQRLAEMRGMVLEKRGEIERLRSLLVAEGIADDQRQEAERQIEDLSRAIQQLNRSFEQLAIGGLDLTSLSDQEPEPFDWQRELEQITRPLLAGLRELTERPRRMEQLRSESRLQEERLEVIQRAIESLTRFQASQPPAVVEERLATLLADWRRRESDTLSQIEMINIQLASLRGENLSFWESAQQSFDAFLWGRGLTLAIAIGIASTLWIFSRLLFALVVRVGQRKQREQARWERLLSYAFRFGGAIIGTLSVLIVFHLREDLLLLALTIVILLGILLSLRTALPRYIDEIRLLLDMGALRVGERVIYQGVPMRVQAMHAYITLSNPQLEGIIRLPIYQVTDLVSRPYKSEPWFPCQVDEYLLLESGSVAQVQRQTVEFVELRIAGSHQRIATASFLQMGVRNLSCQGFGTWISFGIDYRHQQIALEQVPDLLRAGVEEEFARRGYLEQLDSLLVEFKEAGTNSLDYLLYATMQGSAAGSYFGIGRAMQRGCVAVCNREGWVIPFAQLTIHQGEGFRTLTEER